MANGGPRWRSGSFNRSSMSPSPVPAPKDGRPNPTLFSSPTSPSQGPFHARNHSFSPLGNVTALPNAQRLRAGSLRNSSHTTAGTFAPQFIKSPGTEEREEKVSHIEGENDLTGKRYVWIKDSEKAFVQGLVIEELDGGGKLRVQYDNGTQQDVDTDSVDKVNPAKFDRSNDMAELTYLNEPSVVHNLQMRYQSDLIYTYSGLFLVAVNPYCPLPIYTNDYINMYRGRSRDDTKPHIYAVSDEAFRNLVEEGENQSILVTGESGAGKTENTKKVIQYLAAVATSETPGRNNGKKNLSNLSQQILRANPILEAFGNAQTVRNNNSSRFGKFIRIQFTRSGQIAGAFIDWYLLEKSRVVNLNPGERNYHIFYQLLRGADPKMKAQLLLGDAGIEDFEYMKYGNDLISGVADEEEWNSLVEAFHVMGFSTKDQASILRTVAAVLLLGNITVSKESVRADQASLTPEATKQAEKACRLLGISSNDFIEALLHPRVKAGREWVKKVQTPEQVQLSLDALSKGVYERGFGDLVDRINKQLNRSGSGIEDTHFIGVLDIAGFEIFENNSFEQLCINYTNEKLQQFFNHHMFVIEQEEYAREQIEWKFIDFGKDLQPTIDLIELTNPIGIFSCLDEDSVMPKATDKSFTEKLHSLWDRKNPKYRRSKLSQGFMLTHYAAEVEYSTEGWLEKNKDPLNDNITSLLAASTDEHIANLFADCTEMDEENMSSKNRVKKGLFRTVAQRHKEQLFGLMGQLHMTHPHFVRCILPNHKKKPKSFDSTLVLDQLRCNGVLEGIRIARTGFPNRLPFAEFRSRYEVLCSNMPRGHLEGQAAANIILEKLNLDPAFYRVGLTKVFFRAGVLAELEEQRDNLIRQIVSRFQSLARGFTQRRAVNKRLYRAEAARIIQKNFQLYLDMQSNPWWKLFMRMRPLLGATRHSGELKKRDEMIQQLQSKARQDLEHHEKLEDERRRVEVELQKLQNTLEGERALALDKEEIFKRLQEREVELSDKLAGALEDQDSLDDQMDEVLLAKKKAEDELDSIRKELNHACALVATLEEEKKSLQNQISDVENEMDALKDGQNQNTEREETLQQEIRMLNSQVGLKDRKIQDLETKVLKADQDLEVKYAAASKDLQSSKKHIKQLQDENYTIQQQLSELTSASTDHEDTLRLRDSELAILKNEAKSFASEKKSLTDENSSLSTKHGQLQSRVREIQSEIEAMRQQKSRLEREAADAKRVLEEKLNEDAQSGQERQMLESQIEDFKEELFKVQKELSREKQSRDDVQLLADHKYEALQREYESLNQAKLTIERELYAQQDVLRRTTETRTAAENERKEYQTELRNLRQRFVEVQEAKLEAESAAEHAASRANEERQVAMEAELEEKDLALSSIEADRDHLSKELQNLKQIVADSDIFKSRNDQHKERLERELVAIKGRLTASENDNRALLNKVQQKNLDIARSNSRANDSQRSTLNQLQAQKAKQEEENKELSRQLEESQLTITSLEKQKEKLSLSLEDLNHEIAREHKTSRNAEKASSTVNLQLAEVNRKLETERQAKVHAQANSRAIQTSLDNANKELSECHSQLLMLQKVFDPSTDLTSSTYEKAKHDITKTVNMASKLEDAENAARVATERCARAEAQLESLRNRFENEVTEMDTRHTNSKRALLEELDQNHINTRHSPTFNRQNSETPKRASRFSTPVKRHISHAGSDSAKSDRTEDSLAYNSKMDLVSELELVQNQLQMSEMRNRHLQTQIDRSADAVDWQDESPSTRRMHKLERENFRLHDMLDDSAKKVSALENSIRTGQLTLKDVQTKSHEELYDLINSQEQSRRSLLQVHNSAVGELTDAKAVFDELKQTKSKLEVDLRDVRSELDDVRYEREHEQSSRSQLLQEFSELQIKLDAETSKLEDTNTSLNLYKARADDYYNKLEQAEISVLKASRAEQFAKTQCREAEEASAVVMSERKQIDSMVEDLHRQLQSYEERVEDLSADLEGALQSKKRLQNELEDYRSQRASDLEDQEMTVEQTRRKYQNELSTLSAELELERDGVMSIRSENSRLRDELEEYRSKWDDEVLNSSSWAKEKSRLEMALESLSNSRDEAANAHNEAQSKVVSLLSQIRTLRSSVDDASAERDQLVKEKKGLESRLQEANERLEGLSRSESPSMRTAADNDRELLRLKSELAKHEDVASAAVGKMRRAESLAQELQRDMANERDNNSNLHKEKASLDKTVKDLQLKLIDLETKGYSSGSQDVRFLHSRIQELEKQLESFESNRSKEQRDVRNVDRTVRDLQTQIERRDKQVTQLNEDIGKSRDKVDRLLSTIDELQSSDSSNQLQAKRAERELREEKEKTQRLERELEGWKGLRMERRESIRRSGTWKPLSEIGSIRSGAGADERPRSMRGGSVGPNGSLDVPKRKISGQKGFL